MSDLFDLCFAWTVKIEGEYSASPNDPGNWSSGEAGKGRLLGTKYGISGAAYPNLDIKNLTLQQAEQIYQQDYWAPLPACLSDWMRRGMFDAAVQHGLPTAIKLLQNCLNVTQDGIFGPISEAAYGNADQTDLYFCLLCRRWLLYYSLTNFSDNAAGWGTRLLLLGRLYAKGFAP